MKAAARILVVDDEIRYRELYTQVLNSAGFESRAASGSAVWVPNVRLPKQARETARSVCGRVRISIADSLASIRFIYGWIPENLARHQ